MVIDARHLLAPLIALSALLIASVAGAGPLSLQDVAATQSVSQPRMSPTGEHVAYLLRVPRKLYVEADGPAHRHLYVSDLQGASTPFVTDDIDITDMAWSAAGDAVYFLAKRDAEASFNSLYRIDLAGGEAEQVFTHGNSIARIYPSPDGRVIAFLAAEPPPVKSKELAGKGFKAVVYEESVPATHVWLLELSSLEVTRHELPGSASDFAWSADGERYAVALAPTPLVDDFFVRRDIYVVAADDGAVQSQVGAVGKLGPFALSPDGEKVAYIGSVDKHDPREGRLYLHTPGTGERTELVPDYAGHVSQVHWLDDTRVRWVGVRGLYTDYAVANIDAPRPVAADVAAGPIIRSIHGHPGQSAVIAVADTPAHPRELFLLRDGEEPRRLTYSNPWLSDRELAKQEVIRYPARDGLELEAVLISPLNKRAKRVPLIVIVHGGPEANFSNGWLNWYSALGQVFAADGYAVVYPNYRGSTGRGVAFSKLGQARASGAEFDDLVDAKRYLVEQGLADGDRVGITGGSYGGYASMWSASALSEEYSAAVAHVGLSNLVSSFGTGDIPYELYNVHAFAWPWDDWLDMLKRSPVYFAGQTKTPLLIVTGDSDPRVHPSQSLEMYRFVKLRTDTPVRLVFYPGEGHGNTNTAAQYDYSLRLKRWMDHYLKGSGDELPPYELDHAAQLEAAQSD